MKNLLVGTINDNLFAQIVEATSERGSLCLLIDSYGGDLRTGYKIYDHLKGKDNVHCVVVGNCMSAAILVLLGVKKQHRTANEHAQFLIHRPLLEYHGQLTQKDAQKVDSAIEEETKMLMEVYKKELNASEQALFAMLDNEQVFGAMQAKAMGFINAVNKAPASKETDEAALKDVMYNKQLIKKNKMATNEKLEACVKALRDLFAGSSFKNTKVVSTQDGKDLKVETDGEVKTGCKIEAENGSYVLGDNRTIIVKNGVIESIEEPTGADDKKQLEEKVKNLETEKAELKDKLEKAQKEISDFQNLKSQLENVNKMLDEAGGINAVLNAVSPKPSQKSDFDDDGEDDAYKFIKGLGA